MDQIETRNNSHLFYAVAEKKRNESRHMVSRQLAGNFASYFFCKFI
jgi:hypothetical protein